MKTYIGKNKFHFITDYSKHLTKKSNGDDIVLDFGSLTIEERIMLSSYLTILCNDDQSKAENIYETIFNFNSKRKTKTSFHKSFIDDFTCFLKANPHYFAFIKDNFDKIENDKTFIYRQQLNASEMDVLNSLKFQRSYSSLMNVLYIIGVAKQNIVTSALNHISLYKIYKTSSTLAKKRVNEIFKKLNAVSKNKVEYKFIDNEVWFKNGFCVEEKDEYISKEKKEYDKIKEAEAWLNSKNNEIPKKQINENKIAVKIDDQVNQENKINFNSIIDLSGEFAGRFSMNIFKSVKEYIEDVNPYLIQQFEEALTKNYLYEEKTKIYRYFSENYLNVNNEIEKCNELKKVLNNVSLGENWKEIRDKARDQAFTLQNKICSSINKLFDDENDKDHVKYKTAIIQCLKYYKNILFYNK